VRQFKGHETVPSAEKEDVEFQRRLLCQVAEPVVEFCIPEEVHPIGWFVAVVLQDAEADGGLLPHEKFVQFLCELVFHIHTCHWSRAKYEDTGAALPLDGVWVETRLRLK
jgi:hypothetical protein